MKKNDERFVIVHEEGSQLKSGGFRQLLVDKVTGVTYLLCSYGITPLIDAEGKPVITKL